MESVSVEMCFSVTEKHISTLTDSIILLRYVETFGDMRRTITVLKMRGSLHDRTIREYTIDGQGMHIGEPIRNVSGILSGRPIVTPDFAAEHDGTEGEGSSFEQDERASGGGIERAGRRG